LLSHLQEAFAVRTTTWARVVDTALPAQRKAVQAHHAHHEETMFWALPRVALRPTACFQASQDWSRHYPLSPIVAMLVIAVLVIALPARHKELANVSGYSWPIQLANLNDYTSLWDV